MSKSPDSSFIKPFELMECCILTSPTGRSASNLKEFLHALREVEEEIIHHHLLRCFLKPTYQQSHFPNDFAVWSAKGLGDYRLAEMLANFDPLGECIDLSAIRERLVALVEDYLFEMPVVPVARPGFEFYFETSTLFEIKTGLVARNVEELADCLDKVGVSTIYYHFFYGRQKRQENLDDFSRWLIDTNQDGRTADQLQGLDFYLLSLEELKRKVINVLRSEGED